MIYYKQAEIFLNFGIETKFVWRFFFGKIKKGKKTVQSSARDKGRRYVMTEK